MNKNNPGLKYFKRDTKLCLTGVSFCVLSHSSGKYLVDNLAIFQSSDCHDIEL